MWSYVSNILVSIVVSTLAIYDEVDVAIPILGLWCVVDALLICTRTNHSLAFRDSLLLHHMITSSLCVQHYWFAVPRHFLRTLLLLELTTPFVCLHNIMKTRATAWVRTAVWLIVRSVITLQLLRTIGRDIAMDNGVYQASPYVVALITFSASWTLNSSANVSGVQMLLVAYAAHARAQLLPSRFLGIMVQIPVSYLFYNRDGFKRVDHAVLLFNLLRLYEAWSIPVSTFTALVMMANEHALSVVVNAMCMYEMSKNASVEMCAMGCIMAAYIVKCGPRNLTFGHRIGWHAACTTALLRCIPPS